MDKQPKTDTENENLHDRERVNSDTAKGNDFQGLSQSGDDVKANEDGNDTDKYLAMEQPGVTYTGDTEPSNLSDELDYEGSDKQNKWNPEGGNGAYSDAFNQDNYILTDNVDLDEDQNQSISSDDDDFEETNERY